MIQVLAVQKTRIQLLALALLALIAFGALSVARPTFGKATPGSAATAVAPRAVSVPRPQTSSGCNEATYVTGDLVGDASPAAVYASMCANR
jgi:hypothetical protein